MYKYYSNDELKHHLDLALDNIISLINKSYTYDEVLTYANILSRLSFRIVRGRIFDIALRRDETNDFERLEEMFMNKNIKIKVSGKAHLWSWLEFKEQINGDIISYENEGNVIYSITFSVAALPLDEDLNSFGFTCEVIG